MRRRNARGAVVPVDPRWQSFIAFVADMGDRPPGMTLDRENNDLGYMKSNCRWATRKTQIDNRTNTKMLTLGDRTQSMADWAGELGISYGALTMRLDRGWPLERALTERQNSRGTKRGKIERDWLILPKGPAPWPPEQRAEP
jgi:hypothetical protein